MPSQRRRSARSSSANPCVALDVHGSAANVAQHLSASSSLQHPGAHALFVANLFKPCTRTSYHKHNIEAEKGKFRHTQCSQSSSLCGKAKAFKERRTVTRQAPSNDPTPDGSDQLSYVLPERRHEHIQLRGGILGHGRLDHLGDFVHALRLGSVENHADLRYGMSSTTSPFCSRI